MLSNLIGNALEHGERGAPVRVQLDGQDASRVTIHSANRGTIAPDALAQLFDPFRGVQLRRERTRGLGIGLYISREIVNAHRGTLRVRSSQEEGTCFEIELPRGLGVVS